MIKLGDISHLEDNLNPNPNFPHSFGYDTEQKNVVVAYHRDRNEDWERVKPRKFKDLDAYEKYCKTTDQEYSYLFDENKNEYLWSEIPFNENENMDFKPLRNKLIELNLLDEADNSFDTLVWKVVDYEKENDLYNFRDEYGDSETAFNELKSYFMENGFNEYLDQLDENMINLEYDKDDEVLGPLYKHAENLKKEIIEFKNKDLEL